MSLGEVVNVHFARADVRRLRVLIEIGELQRNRRRIEVKANIKGDALGKYEKRLTKIRKEVEEKFDKYEMLKVKHPEKAVRAFIMFKTMSSRDNILLQYHDGPFKRYCVQAICCRPKQYEDRLFMGKWLRVKKAKDPDIINWENLNISKT